MLCVMQLMAREVALVIDLVSSHISLFSSLFPKHFSISAVMELKIIIAVLVRSFEFECTEAKIVQRLSPSLQPFADGKAGSMPLKVYLIPEL